MWGKKISIGQNCPIIFKGAFSVREFIQLQKLIYPDLLETMQQRFAILYAVYLQEPVGRRGIIERTKLSERYIRNEVAFLQQHGFIDVSKKGMFITPDGKAMVEQLHEFIRELSGLTSLEKELKEITGIQQVTVVSGDSSQDPHVKQELGRATVAFLKSLITKNVTIAVTGGTTMAAVADAMIPFDKYQCLFVPARGGTGEKVENQANTIVAKMAAAEKGDYRLLHVPDPLSETLYQTLMEEPSIVETLTLVQHASIVIHGIGEATRIATRRKTSSTIMEKLHQEHAVGEAFGYYFNEKGQVVHKVRTIGIQLEDITREQTVITVAGGETKAAAIASYLKLGKSNMLITDETAARKIVADHM